MENELYWMVCLTPLQFPLKLYLQVSGCVAWSDGNKANLSQLISSGFGWAWQNKFVPNIVPFKRRDSPYVLHFRCRDSPYVVHFTYRDCPYVLHVKRRAWAVVNKGYIQNFISFVCKKDWLWMACGRKFCGLVLENDVIWGLSFIICNFTEFALS